MVRTFLIYKNKILKQISLITDLNRRQMRTGYQAWKEVNKGIVVCRFSSADDLYIIDGRLNVNIDE